MGQIGGTRGDGGEGKKGEREEGVHSYEGQSLASNSPLHSFLGGKCYILFTGEGMILCLTKSQNL